MRTLYYGLIISLFSSNLYSQNVGIGTNAPLQKLHIINTYSGNTATTFPPLLIESGTNAYINIVTPADAEKGILFGHAGNNSSGGMIYNNTSFTNGLQFRTGGNNTRMAIASNGFVGIGTISNLEYILDVNGRMRVRSGGDNTVSAGIWLNNHSQAEAAFIGMEELKRSSKRVVAIDRSDWEKAVTETIDAMSAGADTLGMFHGFPAEAIAEVGKDHL